MGRKESMKDVIVFTVLGATKLAQIIGIAPQKSKNSRK
jgi:hypothetical protein